MKPIVTLTLNPAVDSSCETEAVYPMRKIRTSNERLDPGGGGINAARVINELGGRTFAVYLGGGTSGDVLDELVGHAGVDYHRIHTAEPTRISHTVLARQSGQEYRFTPEGPAIQEAEWRAAFGFLDMLDFDYLIASGSLPRGAPTDLYGQLAEVVQSKDARLVLDTSGPALEAALKAPKGGSVFMAKPSLGEFKALTGATFDTEDDIEKAMVQAIGEGLADILAVTMGGDGAALASRDEFVTLQPPDVEIRSAVGAGDSFVGGMTFGLAQGLPVEEAFALGTAAGTATVLTAGTELCHRDDVNRLWDQLKQELPR
ncbi:MAG: 1-phosphofructokinase family hexose kinase [Pseudomonadota bacterium]